jgi:hypothetical protein
MTAPRFKRILVKLSGEVLAGDQGFGIDPPIIMRVATQIQEITELDVQVGIVIGGGNIFRGLAASRLGMDRVNGDYMGMLATIVNALALQDCLEKIGVATRVMTAINVQEVAEPYIRRRAIRHLEKGRVIILAAAPAALLHHGHRREPSRRRGRCRGDHEGHESGRGCTRRTPSTTRTHNCCGTSQLESAHARPEGDGRDRHFSLHGERPTHPRVQARGREQHAEGAVGREHRNPGGE